MKKKTAISCIAALGVLCLLLALLLPACSNKKPSNETSSGTESGTVNVGDNLSPESNTTSKPETEKPTEKETTETSEKPTETTTEETTEEPTEQTTEKQPDPIPPAPSLQYISYGNGTCSVAGIGTYTDQSVIIPTKSPAGDIVTSVEPKAFFENANIRTVQIPSTVTSIGNMAFGGCSSLVYIMVDSANRAYCDINGVLYTADRTTLIAYPAANQSSALELSTKITTIADMALYKCGNLKTIVFNGSPAEWEKLQIGTMNYTLFSASVTFTDKDK